MAKKRAAAPWGNRVVRTGTAPASSFLGNEANFRIHPMPQQDALTGVLAKIGFVQGVVVNLRTSPEWGRDRGVETLVDGHLRVQLALSRDDETDLPVTYVDLSPDEERSILASFDAVGALAAIDREKLGDLIGAIADEDLRALTATLHAERRQTKTVSFDATPHYRVTVECASAAQQEQLLARLVGEGLTCSMS